MLNNILASEILEQIRGGGPDGRPLPEKDLVQLFAPVMYFAEEEKWLPTNIESFLSTAGLRDMDAFQEFVLRKEHFREDRIPQDLQDLYRSIVRRRVRFRALETIEEKAFVLRFLKHGHNYFLNLPDSDLEAMTIDAGQNTEAHGSQAIWNAAVNRLGNNKPDYRGNCYAKVRRLMRPVHFSPNSHLGRKYNGSWIIIHYFFFYSFNFSTNIHEGDWDSSITVCINTDKGSVFAIFNQHHTTWFTQLNVETAVTQEDWLTGWAENYDSRTNTWRKREPGFSFGVGPNRTHPVGIVANGSHGIYPTPGVIIFGISIPFIKDLPFTVDDRRLNVGIGPPGLGQLPEGFPAARFHWDAIALIEDEPDDEVPRSPFFFKGHWGEVSPTRSGWDGPKGPLHSKIWGDCDRTGHFQSLLLSDDCNFRKRYSRGGKLLATVMMNTHRV